MRKSFGILITMALLTAACATGAVNPGTTPTTTTRNLGAPASMAFALQPFDACEPLLEYVKEHALDMVGPYGLGNGYWGGGPWMAGELAMEDSASPATATAATRNSALQAGVDYSTTNVQEIGVDEPDIVKTDGNRILAIAQGVLYYVDVSGDKPNLLGSLRLDDSWAQEINDFGEDADLKQAIIDLGVEYGLVTDYTAMVVVRDEVFDAQGIKRSNQVRLAIEAAARQQRAQRPAISRRVDSQQPMYSSSRASHSGSGALDAWTLLLFLPLVWLTLRRRQARVAH